VTPDRDLAGYAPGTLDGGINLPYQDL
jgi:hypothetical protein